MFPTGQIYKVHEITQILQGILQSEPILQDLWLEGEISNLGRPSSGHVYFTLKDNNSQIQCAIFRPAASRLRFPMQNGDAVLVNGRLTIYDARSQYQIIGERVVPAGVGELQLAFERLKEQLAEEGLFDAIHKKPLPKFPQKIGLITSATGAAIRDIFRMLQKRYPAVEVLLFPTLVQGEDAASEIAHAIACMNRLPGIDLLIVGRGAGLSKICGRSTKRLSPVRSSSLISQPCLLWGMKPTLPLQISSPIIALRPLLQRLKTLSQIRRNFISSLLPSGII